jgi:hypothetical protein
MIALDPNGCFDYVLARERQFLPESRTTWRLRFLKGNELQAIAEKFRAVDESAVGDAGDIETMVRIGMRGWRGLRDENGSDLPQPEIVQEQFAGRTFSMASHVSMARVPLGLADQAELLQALINGNQLSVLDAKKS